MDTKMIKIAAGICLLAGVTAFILMHGNAAPDAIPAYNIQDKENAKYLQKIWVVQDWAGGGEDGGYYSDKVSFRITKIENGTISGKLATGGIAEPDFYVDSFEGSENIGDFMGTIADKTAACEFQDKAGNRGSLEIIFSSEDMLEASVAYEEKAGQYADTVEDGTWKFRPYTMQDVMNSGEEGSYYVMESELRDEMWKHAYLVSAFLVGERNHIDSFLADEQENVLYHFGMQYQDNSKDLDMKANDVNRDGRMDLEIVYQVEQPSYTTTKCVTHTFFQMEDGSFYCSDLEEDEKNRKDGRVLTVNKADSGTLYSRDGEIYLELPNWQGFSDLQQEWDSLNYALYAEMVDGYESFYIRYSLLKRWDVAKASSDVLYDVFLGHYGRIGEIHTLDVNGLTVYYLPCYYEKSRMDMERGYIIWADLGCGQILKTELRQSFNAYEVDEDTVRPFYIEDMITKLYANLKIGIMGEGEIEIVSGSRSDREMETYTFYYYERFGLPIDYEKDEYYENTNCSVLIENLFEAMQAGEIEKLLKQGREVISPLSVQEKLDVLRDEISGHLGDADDNLYYNGYDLYREWYRVRQKEERQDILILEKHDGEHYAYYYFTCYPDSDGNLWTEKGRRTEAQTDEHYFLSDNGVQYLCIPNRNEDGEIEGVALYDFDSPDNIGMLVYITKRYISVCPFVRDNGWAEYSPWYLYDEKENEALHGEWVATEYLGASTGCIAEEEKPLAYEMEREITERLKAEYLDGQKVIRMDHSNEYASASEYGYYYRSWDYLYKVYGQPESLAMEAPFCCVRVKLYDTGEWVDMITDKNGKTVLYVQGRFFLLEKTEGADMGLRTLE